MAYCIVSFQQNIPFRSRLKAELRIRAYGKHYLALLMGPSIRGAHITLFIVFALC